VVRLVVILLVALAAMPASAAAAVQSNPFLPQPEQPTAGQDQAPAQAPVAPAPVQQQTTDTGISSGTQTLLIVAAIALIGGIWFVIARDARRATAGRVRVHTSRTDPDDQRRRATRPPPRGRKPSPAERRRKKRGRAR
jgi:hypothetical protein